MKPIALSLPWPPSNNVYYRHVGSRVLLSARGRSYMQEVALAVLQAGSPSVVEYPVAVWIEAHPPNRAIRDGDNLPKGIFDSLRAAKVLEKDDNRHVAWHCVSWGEVVPDGEVRVFIAPASMAPKFDG